MAGTRSFAGGAFSLDLDGVNCGFVQSVEGGAITAEVIEERPTAGSFFTKKHIGQPKYEPTSLAIGFGMAQNVYDWIAASWTPSYQRKDGSIVASDASLKAKTERQFFHALITETTFPALDGTAKTPGYITVKFAPELTRTAAASGTLTAPKVLPAKQFVPSNFRFELDGLPCQRVRRIESITVTQTPAQDIIGQARVPTIEPVKIEFPNLQVTIAQADEGPWSQWHEDFVVKGECDDAHEKGGAIVLLAPNKKDELGRITLGHVGIFGLRSGAAAAPGQVATFTVDLYVEQMQLQIGKPLPVKPQPERPVVGPSPLRPVQPTPLVR